MEVEVEGAREAGDEQRLREPGDSFEQAVSAGEQGDGIAQFLEGEGAEQLGLTGNESYTVTGIVDDLEPGKQLHVTATDAFGAERTFGAICRIDTPVELEYYRNGGILQYVLRGLMAE